MCKAIGILPVDWDTSGSNFAISGHLAEANAGGCHLEILPLTC